MTLSDTPTPAEPTQADLLARERIRHTIASYTWAGDRFKIQDLANLFTPDGVLHIRGQEPAIGREAIVATLGAVDPDRPRPTTPDGRFFIRHFIANVLIESVTETEARASSYFVVYTPAGLDHWGRYRDELVPDGSRWLFRTRSVWVDATPGVWAGGEG
jgi:hypothetical protein